MRLIDADALKEAIRRKKMFKKGDLIEKLIFSTIDGMATYIYPEEDDNK